MAATAREFFTVDLRGLRAALAARAALQGMTESDVLRSVLAAALGGTDDSACVDAPDKYDLALAGATIKLSVRLSWLAAHRLERQARAAGLSRRAYLCCLIDGAPPVIASADRAALAAALSASAAELAVLSRDINHLTQLLRCGAVDAARPYRVRLDNLDADVRAHLDKAALTLMDLQAARIHADPLRAGSLRRSSSP